MCTIQTFAVEFERMLQSVVLLLYYSTTAMYLATAVQYYSIWYNTVLLYYCTTTVPGILQLVLLHLYSIRVLPLPRTLLFNHRSYFPAQLVGGVTPSAVVTRYLPVLSSENTRLIVYTRTVICKRSPQESIASGCMYRSTSASTDSVLKAKTLAHREVHIMLWGTSTKQGS